MKKLFVLREISKQEGLEQFKKEVLLSLSQTPKFISAKFIYDEEGSKLFSEKLKTEDYYLSHKEQQIFEVNKVKIIDSINAKKFNMIDLGAGDALKSRVLIKEALNQGCQIQYVPVDISHEGNLQLMKQFQILFPDLSMKILTGLYEDGLEWASQNLTGPNMFMFLGSTIGCQEQDERKNLLELLSSKMSKGDLLMVSFDLWKDPQIITKAYNNDEKQKAFLTNSLRRINKQLQGNFNIKSFSPHSYFDPFSNKMTGVVISQIDQTVSIAGQNFQFQKSEPTNIIFSKKWTEREIDQEMIKYPLQKVWAFVDKQQQFINVCFTKK